VSRGLHAAGADVRLDLLGGFRLRCADDTCPIPMSAQRVLAFVALHDRPLRRTYVAGVLWSNSSEKNSRASLRSALWRLGRVKCAPMLVWSRHLELSPRVTVDVGETEAKARRLQDDDDECEEEDLDTVMRSRDLLPGWYDDWVVTERERLRQLRLHALESSCARLILAGSFGRAVQAALVAIQEEPLRETAHRALIQAHLAEGNAVEAVRQYRRYTRLLWEELRLEPSPQTKALVQGLAMP
jgi:DNA-binding SARP family transcriptional activator